MQRTSMKVSSGPAREYNGEPNQVWPSSLENIFFYSHPSFFAHYAGNVNDEPGERFYQDIASMENKYKGNWGSAMLADFC